jgi:type II secretory pathway predicted ATPase ExeA
MYKDYYGFTQRPFTLLPNPEFLFMSKQHSLALSVMDFGLMDEAGFIVITGEVGAGKSTLVRHLLNTVDDSKVTIGLVSNTLRSFGELMQWILLAFGLEHTNKSNVELYQTFVEFLIAEYAKGKRVVLIIDEAQNMDAATLEELRVLSNINADRDLILQTILVGQPQLRKTLKDEDLEQFSQRIVADYHLEPLGKAEIVNYIKHRLAIAGGSPKLFDDHALNYVVYYSKGVPRLINLLCDMALIYGFVRQKQTIDSEIVAEVVRDKLKGGLSPIRNSAPKKTKNESNVHVMNN